MTKLERVLAIIAIIVLVILVTGTVYGLMTGSRAKKLAREDMPAAVAGSDIYEGIGSIRARTTDDPPAVVIVNVAFPYDSSDRQFREELSSRRDELREAAIAFLAGKSAVELAPERESAVEAALRDTLNGLLTFGRIDELYFSQFQVIR